MKYTKQAYLKLNNKYKKLQTNTKVKFRDYKNDKKELQDSLNRKVEECEQLRKDLKAQKAKTKMYKDRLQFDYDEKKVVKLILKLHAENKLIGRIHKAIQANFDRVWDFDRIQKYLNIENLDIEFRKYYYKKRDEYEEIREIEDNRERNNKHH